MTIKWFLIIYRKKSYHNFSGYILDGGGVLGGEREDDLGGGDILGGCDTLGGRDALNGGVILGGGDVLGMNTIMLSDAGDICWIF